MAKDRVRLDKLLLERGLAGTRSKAEALIRTGAVLVEEVPVDKPGTLVERTATLRVKSPQSAFVGRGGEKLAGALDFFQIEIEGRTVLDIGSSTGGFTDCMLQRGARRVYAVDVGTNQLDHRLRVDPRVVVMERLNAKMLTPEMFDPPATLATIDVSFIGLRKVLAPVAAVLMRPFEILALVKPQFELSPKDVSAGGVVRDVQLQLKAVKDVVEFAGSLNLQCSEPQPAVLRGNKKRNQEYFVHMRSTV